MAASSSDVSLDLEFSEAEIQRYSRHILLPEIGGTGQAALGRARVLVVGAGGLGSPLLLYLAASGVGTIGIVDDDHVELSNLQRQIAHGMGSLGVAKTTSAAAAARAINPGVEIVEHRLRLTAPEAEALIPDYDIVCDGSDNFATRYLVADTCVRARRVLVSAAVLRFEGQLSVFKPHARPRRAVLSLPLPRSATGRTVALLRGGRRPRRRHWRDGNASGDGND